MRSIEELGRARGALEGCVVGEARLLEGLHLRVGPHSRNRVAGWGALARAVAGVPGITWTSGVPAWPLARWSATGTMYGRETLSKC